VSEDNRQHPRKDIHPPVAYQLDDGPRVDATCENLSLGGMFLRTTGPIPAFGTPVTVFVHFPGLKQETAIKSIVRWSKPGGIGIQFGVMGARETHALTQLLG
jgi:type IV pilus assembly protein PilZ